MTVAAASSDALMRTRAYRAAERKRPSKGMRT
jgi:hypothetical protein